MIKSDISTQTLFCESARAEAGGQVTLVGIYPDTVRVMPAGQEAGEPSKTATLSSLCLYTRTRLRLDKPIASPLTHRFYAPSKSVIVEHVMEQDFIELHAEKAREGGNEYVMLLAQLDTRPFPIIEEGRFVMAVEFEGAEHFSGAINFRYATPDTEVGPTT